MTTENAASARPLNVVMLGATGAVGGAALTALQGMPAVQRVTLLNRRPLPEQYGPDVAEHLVDPLNPASYRHLLAGHSAAICTLGVGQPSKVSQSELVAIDKTAVVAFATACKQAGIRHFELLASVAADPKSASFYLRTKGELRDALGALNFERLSIFQPSVILTPTNRYDWVQGVTLAVFPALSRLLLGPLIKYRGIPVETLGRAMAVNLTKSGSGLETLHWSQFMALAERGS
jgi:uncharacterized protein YbjT (DUF2867 family)